MDTIRLAIIGTGGMANGHAASFKKEDDVQIVACCDVIPDAAESFAQRHGIPNWYEDYREMLDREDIDAISVVTSDAAHCEISVAALKKGIHVLCEKPMATTLEEAAEMYEAAKKSRKMNMIQFSYRPMAALERARKIISDGLLGDIKHVEASYLQAWLSSTGWGDWRDKPAFLWRMSKKHGGGTLADIGCHIFDFTTYAAGDVAKLCCMMKSFGKGVSKNTHKGYKLDADDSFFANVEFKSGAVGVIHSTRWAQGHQNSLRLRVFGDKGSISIDTDNGRDKLNVCIGKFQRNNALWNTIPAGIQEESNYSRFIRSIRDGKQEAPTFRDGLRIQAILDACHRSADEGGFVDVADPTKAAKGGKKKKKK